MSDAVALLLGLALAGVGGELFVQGAVGIAAWARVPARLVATTVLAFATSMPELAVSTGAALAGTPAIGFGDALGANVANVGLVLGIAMFVGGLRVEPDAARRDVGTAIAAPVLTALLVLDGRCSRADGVVLLAAFAGWLVVSVRSGLRHRDRTPPPEDPARRSTLVVRSLLGLVGLVAAGRLVADAAKGIGNDIGLDPFVVGATLVAIGTTFPEMATALTAARRGRHEIGLGNALGSNIFNGLWIVGLVAVLSPFDVGRGEVAVGLGFGVLLMAGLAHTGGGPLGRARGALLLAGYATYVVVIVAVGPS